MMKTTKSGTMPDTYFDLVRQFPLVSIRSFDHVREASTFLNLLLSRSLDEGGEAYVDALSDLIELFETEHIPIVDVPPGEVLKELLYQNRLTQAELAKQVGIAQSTLSSICAGTRKPTVAQAVKLGERFKLRAAAFLPL